MQQHLFLFNKRCLFFFYLDSRNMHYANQNHEVCMCWTYSDTTLPNKHARTPHTCICYTGYKAIFRTTAVAFAAAGGVWRLSTFVEHVRCVLLEKVKKKNITKKMYNGNSTEICFETCCRKCPVGLFA